MALTKIKSSSIAPGAITPEILSGNTLANILIAGDYISFAANGRISTILFAGNDISIAANGRISSTATGRTTEFPVHPFVFTGL